MPTKEVLTKEQKANRIVALSALGVEKPKDLYALAMLSSDKFVIALWELGNKRRG